MALQSQYREPHIVPELWWWINRVERKTPAFVPVADRYCKPLIKKLKRVMPLLKKYGKDSDQFLFEDERGWVESLEDKLLKEPHMRIMKFDFVKGVIHKNLILRSHELKRPEFWNYRPPYYITGRDDVLRDSRTGKKV